MGDWLVDWPLSLVLILRVCWSGRNAACALSLMSRLGHVIVLTQRGIFQQNGGSSQKDAVWGV